MTAIANMNALAEFFDFKDSKRIFRARHGAVPKGVVGVAHHVPLVPGLKEVFAMVDGDAIKPGAQRRFAPKLTELAVGLQKDVVSGILGLGGIAQETQGQIVNVARMLFIDGAKLG